VEVWLALLFYSGGVMDDVPLLGARGIRRLFGCVRVPDATTFARWLRRCDGERSGAGPRSAAARPPAGERRRPGGTVAGGERANHPGGRGGG
jgi:hypothetical protein